MDTQRHKGKVVIITAGAHGIGEAAVRRFLNEGARVLAADISLDRLTELKNSLGPQALLHTCEVDVADQASVDRMIQEAVDTFGQLDVLVNHAGIVAVGTVEQISAAEWHRVMDVGVSSIFYAVRAALPHLRKTRGNIVNTGSISGFGGAKSLAAYYAAKGAVVNFTRYLAVEHGHEGIRVNGVAPGPTLSNPGLLDQEGPLEVYLQNIPMKRLGQPEDIAKVISFLASDEASYINGHNVVVDGGLTAWTGEPDLGLVRKVGVPQYK